MKKILLVAALMLGLTAAASAQQIAGMKIQNETGPRAIGIRGGWGVDLSYQHGFGSDFVEADLALDQFNTIAVAASYNFSLAQFGNGFNVYAGPSASVGLGFSGWFGVGVGGNIGIEYVFDIPLQISLDIRPQIGLQFGGAHLLNYWGYPALGIRYMF